MADTELKSRSVLSRLLCLLRGSEPLESPWVRRQQTAGCGLQTFPLSLGTSTMPGPTDVGHLAWARGLFRLKRQRQRQHDIQALEASGSSPWPGALMTTAQGWQGARRRNSTEPQPGTWCQRPPTRPASPRPGALLDSSEKEAPPSLSHWAQGGSSAASLQQPPPDARGSTCRANARGSASRIGRTDGCLAQRESTTGTPGRGRPTPRRPSQPLPVHGETGS